MADATIGVAQAASPDRLIDNESLVIGSNTVYRQRVQDPESIASLAALNTVFGGRFPKNAKQFADGEYRTAGGKLSLSLASPLASFHLSNPTGSGRTITITEFTLGTSTTVDITYITDATSTGTAAAVFMPNRAYEGVATSVGVLKAGAGVLTGGTALSPVTRLTTNGDRIPYTAVLLPGQSLAARATAGATLEFYGSVTWIESTI